MTEKEMRKLSREDLFRLLQTQGRELSRQRAEMESSAAVQAQLYEKLEELKNASGDEVDRVETLTAQLNEKDGLLNELRAGLDEKESGMYSLAAQLDEKNRLLEELRSELSGKDKTIAELENSLSEKNSELLSFRAGRTKEAEQPVRKSEEAGCELGETLSSIELRLQKLCELIEKRDSDNQHLWKLLDTMMDRI